MSQVSLQLKIATHLMAALMNQDRNRRLIDRLDDIQHSLEVATELIRKSQGISSPGADLTLEPRPVVKTREVVVDRHAPPLKELLEQRGAGVVPRVPKGPTRH